LTVVDIEGWSRNEIQAERPDVLNYANDTTRLHVEHAQILFKRAVATAHARLDVSGKLAFNRAEHRHLNFLADRA